MNKKVLHQIHEVINLFMQFELLVYRIQIIV